MNETYWVFIIDFSKSMLETHETLPFLKIASTVSIRYLFNLIKVARLTNKFTKLKNSFTMDPKKIEALVDWYRGFFSFSAKRTVLKETGLYFFLCLLIFLPCG